MPLSTDLFLKNNKVYAEFFSPQDKPPLPFFSIHHFPSPCPPKRFSPCSLQRKFRTPWTDLSLLKDCRHLSCAHLKPLTGLFVRGTRVQRGRSTQEVLDLTEWLKLFPKSLDLCHVSIWEITHREEEAYLK